MKIDMIQVLADRKELQKIQQRMNTNFSISEIEVKICPDCGAEHVGENNRCDMCLMEAERLAYENGCADITYSECYTQPLFSRVWAMPNKNTFDIKPIKLFVEKYWDKNIISVDPFARNTKYATYRNDLNPETDAEYHLHANDFIRELIAKGVKADLVFFDPPYSPHQTKECYSGFGINIKYEDDARHGWSKTRVSIAEILKPNGIVLNFGWDTIGIGKKRGMELIEVMLVSHGIGHNDTICMAEQKRSLF